jgi:hypothetical protein
LSGSSAANVASGNKESESAQFIPEWRHCARRGITPSRSDLNNATRQLSHCSVWADG